MEEMNSSVGKKENTNKKFVWLLVVLILIILGLVVYIMYDKDILHFKESSDVVEKNEKNKKEEETNEQEDASDDSDLPLNQNVSLSFDASKCINNPGGNYTLAVYKNNAGTINISLDQSKKNISFAFNAHQISQNYSLGWVTSTEDIELQKQDIAFAQEIDDIFIGGFGQSVVGDTALFLMHDGSVEYIPLKKALATDPYNLKSYGKVPEVSSIVKFYTANTTGGVTTLAQKADGTFYDLGIILQKTGNY